MLRSMVWLTAACLFFMYPGAIDRAQAQQQLCANQTTTVDIVNCLAREYENEDAALNAVWQQIMAQFKSQPDYMPASEYKAWRQSLLEAQRAWITYKDTDCRDAVGYEHWGGTIRPIMSLSCLVDKTRARRIELQERYLNER